VPLRIWSKTGTLGDSKGTPLTVKRPGPKMAKYNIQVNVDVSTARIGLSRHRTRLERVEVSFDKWHLAHGDIHCRIHCRTFFGCPFVVENG